MVYLEKATELKTIARSSTHQALVDYKCSAYNLLSISAWGVDGL